MPRRSDLVCTPAGRNLLARIRAAGGSMVIHRHGIAMATERTASAQTISGLAARGFVMAKRLGRGKFQLDLTETGTRLLESTP